MTRFIFRTIPVFLVFAASGSAQEPAVKQAVQQKLAEVKQHMAENQAKQRQYAWVETTEISLKGEVKKRDQKDCKYGPDGKVQKTAIPGAAPAAPKEESGGRRGGRRGGAVKERIVENKKEEMKDYMEEVAALIHRYVPPDPQAMQAAFQNGKASFDKASGALTFSDYAIPGDKVTLVFDPAAKKLRTYSVATHLEGEKDEVNLAVNFGALADGTSYVQQTILDAKAKNISVKTTNSGHKKIGG